MRRTFVSMCGAMGGVIAGATVLAGAAHGQVDIRLGNDPSAAFYEWSLLSVRPPDPTTFQIHDLITIIVNENSRQLSEQTLETEKEFDISGELLAFLSATEFLDFRLTNGIDDPISLIKAMAESEFTGEGEYERKDRITDRITATVIDVKPNGVLVLEATRTLVVDEETTVLVLSGMCETRNVTREGVVQSNQLANLMLSIQHEGPVHDAGSKGWLTRAVEAIFPF